jgi:hypothetical protein
LPPSLTYQPSQQTVAHEQMEKDSQFDLQELYARMKHPLTEQSAQPHAALKPKLRPYQLRAAYWCCRRPASPETLTCNLLTAYYNTVCHATVVCAYLSEGSQHPY